jgi:tRNA uridine 5-carboxymethylaminomethyl modification enzyme
LIYDVIVVGGGHAGCEAALASARMGISTLLVTIRKGDIARMPCNPAIGGLAKGQLVREIDALGGEMGLCIDYAGIQFRMLNRAKGPAVWSPRAQADKSAYHERMLEAIGKEKNLELLEAEITGLVLEGGKVRGVTVAGGGEIQARKVILALGTFPNGLMHIGEKQIPGGREGEPPSCGLSDMLAEAGLERARLKTGTPPRLLRGSIDFSRCEIQPGDEDPAPFSFRTEKLVVDQIPCYMTWTGERTHRIINENIGRAPLFSGQIQGTGPRYCPSIEDKVVRFSEKPRHQIFLEPEGRESEEIYVNGLSTSLPAEVQLEMVRSVPGLEDAEIARYGYAIEYDFFPPHQIHSTLETRSISGLYFAGQINGTSGYEEAAAQGLIAGINAARALHGRRSFVPGRSEAYIGVLIDDLVTKEIREPYRMFTSRAEFRLSLRQDNADERLLRYAVRFGLLPRQQWEDMIGSKRAVRRARRRLEEESVNSETAGKIRAVRLLQRPGITLDDLEPMLQNGPLGLEKRERESLEIGVKYYGYIQRQDRAAEKLKRMERKSIPDDFSYAGIDALSAEAREVLERFRPETLGKAARLAGVRNSDISVLMVFLERAGYGR